MGVVESGDSSGISVSRRPAQEDTEKIESRLFGSNFLLRLHFLGKDLARRYETPAGLARQARPRTERSEGGGSTLAPRKANTRALNPSNRFLADIYRSSLFQCPPA